MTVMKAARLPSEFKEENNAKGTQEMRNRMAQGAKRKMTRHCLFQGEWISNLSSSIDAQKETATVIP